MEYLRVSGIYDLKTLHFLKQKGVQNFTFDMRPSSFNFVQSYKVNDFINQTYQYGDEYALQFDLDKDFVISNVLERTETGALNSVNNLSIEFCSARSLEECEIYDRPFIWHYDEHNVAEFINSPLLKTVLFKQSTIAQLELSQKIYPFMDDFFKKCPENVSVEIEMDWTSPILSTLLDFFPINGLNYAINQRVEKSFRNVDLQLVDHHLEHTLASFKL